MDLLTRFRRNYLPEAITILVVALILSVIGSLILNKKIPAQLETSVSILVTAVLFIIGTLYGRIKDRREAKLQRAIGLLAEWHSADIRASRMFVSHFREQVAKGESDKMLALSQIEYNAGQDRLHHATIDPSKEVDLNDWSQREFHFFKIYQFFERWSLLLRNGDISRADSNVYMSSYGQWYLDEFLIPWFGNEGRWIRERKQDNHEVGSYILDSLHRILLELVGPSFLDRRRGTEVDPIENSIHLSEQTLP